MEVDELLNMITWKLTFWEITMAMNIKSYIIKSLEDLLFVMNNITTKSNQLVQESLYKNITAVWLTIKFVCLNFWDDEFL